MLQYLTFNNLLGVLGAAVALGLIVLGRYLRSRYPLYPTRWIRCDGCLDLYLVPTWEAEGFRCPKCRDGK